MSVEVLINGKPIGSRSAIVVGESVEVRVRVKGTDLKTGDSWSLRSQRHLKLGRTNTIPPDTDLHFDLCWRDSEGPSIAGTFELKVFRGNDANPVATHTITVVEAHSVPTTGTQTPCEPTVIYVNSAPAPAAESSGKMHSAMLLGGIILVAVLLLLFGGYTLFIGVRSMGIEGMTQIPPTAKLCDGLCVEGTDDQVEKILEARK
jgi:hypothetical protein